MRTDSNPILFLFLALAIVALQGFLVAVPSEIRSRSFVVVDSTGRPLAYMASDPDGGTFGLLNRNGDTVLNGLVTAKSGGSFGLRDSAGIRRVVVRAVFGAGEIYIDSAGAIYRPSLRPHNGGE